MKNIIQTYESFCKKHEIPFKINSSIRPYDESTLFCPAGMQQFKPLFRNIEYTGTQSNIQSCIRMNDFDELGDINHFLYFNMIGLFSFRQMSIEQSIDFWMQFISVELELHIDYVTVHPDVFTDWSKIYQKWNIPIRQDGLNCTWSDGEIGGYCTESFINDVEIGNIVNPMGNCIDVGFGLERIDGLINGYTVSLIDKLRQTCSKIIDDGYYPSDKKQGYVLRKLLREIWKRGETFDHPFFVKEVERQENNMKRYLFLKNKNKDKTKEWWFDTHGIRIDDIYSC